MGVINRSPNSFYDPCLEDEKAIAQASAMISQGVDIIDVGGEATNPFVDLRGDAPSTREEIKRVVPLLKVLKKTYPDLLISVDTSRPEVMQASLEAGADMINDQRALALPGALEVVTHFQPMLCLMHFFSPPRQPDISSREQLLERIFAELQRSRDRCVEAGVWADQIALDPGFGGGHFGKSTAENFHLLSCLPNFLALGHPLLVGWSRKSMLGEVLGGAPVVDRLYAGIAAATLCLHLGASILRTHDVGPTRDALRVHQALITESGCREQEAI